MENKEERKPYSVGVDIGGTNTVFGIVDHEGNIIGSSRFPTGAFKEAETFCEHLSKSILKLMRDFDVKRDEVEGIGIGAPCANFNTGFIEAATNLPWPSPIPLRQLVAHATALPVAVTNDANATAVGEMIYGVAEKLTDFVVITLGTGVGSGIVCDGHLLTGSHGFAGELGHCSVRRPSDRMCACGRLGCLQTYCSAEGVCETARRLLAQHPDTPSTLRDLSPQHFTSQSICREALAGDTLARETFRFTGEILGEACADFATFCDPQAFIIFGGVAKAGVLITDPMRLALEENLLHLYRNRIKILASKFSDEQTAILGAAAMTTMS